MMPSGSASKTERIANAIAYAEGYFVSGSRPERNNNPGDLTKAFGQDYTGYDGIFIVFATPTDGWQALFQQVNMMLDNTSSIYNDEMTIYEVAQRYTTTQQQEWANNVASYLGVSTNTPLREV